MKKLNKDILGYTKAATTIGIGTAIGAGMQSQVPAGTPSLTAGFGTLSSGMGIVGTAMMGGHALRMAKNLNKKSKRY